MMPKVIKNESEYEAALARIDEIFDAEPDTDEGNECELLCTLVEKYEDEHYPIPKPTPIEAIKYRMEQRSLTRSDLVPLLGSRARVSEILSGKRTLSLEMIRKLHEGLDIPLDVLTQSKAQTLCDDATAAKYNRFPFTEMFNRGWFASFFKGTLAEAKYRQEELCSAFAGKRNICMMPCAMNRKSDTDNVDDILLAWRLRVMSVAEKEPLAKWDAKVLDNDFFSQLVHLSYIDNSPLLAKEYLNKAGIHFVIERHLSRTRLDGSSMMLPDGSPLVALTLRFDRLDSFWFTLLHELSHVKLHLVNQDTAFFDDMTSDLSKQVERAADENASNALIDKNVWASSGLSAASSATDVRRFAQDNRIGVFIPAGRIRHETRNYKIFSNLVGEGCVRRLFV